MDPVPPPHFPLSFVRQPLVCSDDERPERRRGGLKSGPAPRSDALYSNGGVGSQMTALISAQTDGFCVNVLGVTSGAAG